MPAFVNISVGSFAGTTGELGWTTCPFFSKYSVNFLRISAAVMTGNIRATCVALRLASLTVVGASRYSVGSATRFAIDAPRSPFWRESRAKLGALPRVEIERGASTILWTAPHLKGRRRGPPQARPPSSSDGKEARGSERVRASPQL